MNMRDYIYRYAPTCRKYDEGPVSEMSYERRRKAADERRRRKGI